VREHEGEMPTGRPMCRWDDNLKTDLKEIEWESVDWIYLAQDRGMWLYIVNMVMVIWFP
jgi:hypothetical protein